MGEREEGELGVLSLESRVESHESGEFTMMVTENGKE